MKLVLASASPRRREILSNAGYSCLVRPAGITECLDPSLPVSAAVESLARQKADFIAKNAQADELVLAADTIVVRDNNILGKPRDEADAFAMLRSLSGRSHTVCTGVCIALPGADGVREAFACASTVRFHPLSDEEIRRYISTGEPMDKAGAYGIQGYGCLLVEGIEGDYFNVMGLPIAQTARKLSQYGVNGSVL